MQINNSYANVNHPLFGTKISIASPAMIDTIKCGFESRKNVEVINPFHTSIEKLNMCGIRNEAEVCYTNQIATCTAGIVTNLKKKVADMFFHLIPNESNFEKYKEFADNIPQGDNAIIVGSKGGSKWPLIIGNHPRTGELWDKIGKDIRNKKIPISRIGDMADAYNVEMFYNGNTDHLYLSYESIEGGDFVKSIDGLKRVCRQIEISPTDTLEFIG